MRNVPNVLHFSNISQNKTSVTQINGKTNLNLPNQSRIPNRSPPYNEAVFAARLFVLDRLVLTAEGGFQRPESGEALFPKGRLATLSAQLAEPDVGAGWNGS